MIALRHRACTAAACLLLAAAGQSAAAQPARTVQVARPAPVVDAPRGDGYVLATVPADTVLEVVGQIGNWVQVNAPAEGNTRWRRGWIHASYLVGANVKAPSVDEESE